MKTTHHVGVGRCLLCGVTRQLAILHPHAKVCLPCSRDYLKWRKWPANKLMAKLRTIVAIRCGFQHLKKSDQKWLIGKDLADRD